MGELIEFKKGPGNVWDDGGEAFPEGDEAETETPKPSLLILPILLFLDAFSLGVALVCRPVAATPLIALGALIWSGLRDLFGLGPGWALGLCLLAWLVAHVLGGNIDQLVKPIESAETTIMRDAAKRHRGLGRVLHLTLYLYVALAPIAFTALLTGTLPAPAWLPHALKPPAIALVPPLIALAIGLVPAVAAVTTRYNWHPVARYATLLGSKRKFTIAARSVEVE
jgi:hypothetical protein